MAAKLKHILLSLLALNATNASPVSLRALSATDNVDVQAHLGNKLEASGSSSEAGILPRLKNLEKEVGICSLAPKPKITNQKIKLVVIELDSSSTKPGSMGKLLRRLQSDIPKQCLTKVGQDKQIHLVNAPGTYISRYGTNRDVIWNITYQHLMTASAVVPDAIVIPLTSDCKAGTYDNFVKKATGHVSKKLLSSTDVTHWRGRSHNLAFLTKDEILTSPRLHQARESNESHLCGAERMELVQSKAEEGFHGVASLAAAPPSDTVQARSDSEYPVPPEGYPTPPGGYPAPPGGYPAPPGGY